MVIKRLPLSGYNMNKQSSLRFNEVFKQTIHFISNRIGTIIITCIIFGVLMTLAINSFFYQELLTEFETNPAVIIYPFFQFYLFHTFIIAIIIAMIYSFSHCDNLNINKLISNSVAKFFQLCVFYLLFIGVILVPLMIVIFLLQHVLLLLFPQQGETIFDLMMTIVSLIFLFVFYFYCASIVEPKQKRFKDLFADAFNFRINLKSATAIMFICYIVCVCVVLPPVLNSLNAENYFVVMSILFCCTNFLIFVLISFFYRFITLQTNNQTPVSKKDEDDQQYNSLIL